MSMAERFALAIPLALVAGMAFAADGPGLGKPISEAGLPSGSGTPAQGADIYAQKCEVCHGKDGVGGTNAALANPPGKSDRTTALYVPNATTIFDFTRRAMPWPQPKTLANDEVYALTAYILARNKIIGENDVMNAETLPKVAMPNRNAFVSRYPEKH
jgi:mono/diheme cytochrome c family protein